MEAKGNESKKKRAAENKRKQLKRRNDKTANSSFFLSEARRRDARPKGTFVTALSGPRVPFRVPARASTERRRVRVRDKKKKKKRKETKRSHARISHCDREPKPTPDYSPELYPSLPLVLHRRIARGFEGRSNSKPSTCEKTNFLILPRTSCAFIFFSFFFCVVSPLPRGSQRTLVRVTFSFY